MSHLSAGLVLLLSVLLNACTGMDGTAEDSSPERGLVVACVPTPAEQEGTHYLPGAPFKDVLYPPGMRGVRLVMSGTIYAADCRTPLGGAIMDVWQADARGQYDFSERFVLRGKVRANEQGRYQFETIVPAQYGSCPPHMHVKISHPGAAPLITQLYFAGNNNDGMNPALVVYGRRDDGAIYATFDWVLGG
jgi:catechol 1,2-dioxygenase